VGSGLTTDAGRRAPPAVGAGTGDGDARRGRTDGVAPLRGLAGAGLAFLVTWPFVRQLLVNRARPR